jgi:hypothetical protein
MQGNTANIEKGSKVKVDGELYIVCWDGISYKAEKPNDTFDTVKFKDQDVEAGDVEVLDDDANVTDAVDKLKETIDFDELTDELEGRNGLRKSKPDADHFTQYVWRMAVFHSGYKNEMPVMARTWLQTYLDRNDIDATVGHNKDTEGEEIKEFVEKTVDAVIMHFNRNPAQAAERWKGLAY